MSGSGVTVLGMRKVVPQNSQAARSFFRAAAGSDAPQLGQVRAFISLSYARSHRMNKARRDHHAHPFAVSTPASFPTRLYIVTFVNGSPRIPSWIAHERLRMLSAASGWQNGVKPSSCA